jgi:Icc protein
LYFSAWLSNGQSKTHIESLWNAWNEVISINHIPMKGCIGNHDVWYTPEPVSEADKNDTMYGKGMILKQLSLPAPIIHFIYSARMAGNL